MKKNNNMIQKISNNIQKLIDLTYTKTYNSPTLDKKSLERSTGDIHKSIDNIMSNVYSKTGRNNISMLYNRLNDYNNDKDLFKQIEMQFGGTAVNNMDSILSIFLENKFIADLDNEIDIICKYMPLLEEALETKVDIMLSADNVNKNFVTFKNKKGDMDGLVSKLDRLKDVYDIEDKIRSIAFNTCKYGEQFYIVAPYSELLEDQLNNNKLLSTRMKENSLIINESTIIENIFENDNKLFDSIDINVYNGMPEEFITEAKALSNRSHDVVFDNSSSEQLIMPDGLSLMGGKNNKKEQNVKVDINGCYVKQVDRKNVIPVYIENTCMGYFYVEVTDNTMEHYIQNMNDPTISLKRNRIELTNSDINMRDSLLRNIADRITSQINLKFIKNNESFKRELYLIMKYSHEHSNGSIGMNLRFIKPDHMFHFYYKKDEKSHRGISDLYKSLIPAKLYSCIYISNVFAILTRGQDKRVYYVKQQIDTNISQLMLNTINQIKKSNFGLRDLNNLETILNITGRFNDYIIPTNSSGDSPINFEIMQGQDIQIKTELLDLLESLAVDSTGVPLELVQSRRNTTDFAIQVQTANIKVLRHALARQSRLQKLLSPFITSIFNYEYASNEHIMVVLPSTFHNNTDNTTILIENTINMVNSIALIEYGDNPDPEKEKEIYQFKRLWCRRYLGSVIDIDQIDELKKEANMLANIDKKKEE